MKKNLPIYCGVFAGVVIGLGLLGQMMILVCEPTTATMEKVNKANRQRMVEQPAINNKAALAQNSEHE